MTSLLEHFVVKITKNPLENLDNTMISTPRISWRWMKRYVLPETTCCLSYPIWHCMLFCFLERRSSSKLVYAFDIVVNACFMAARTCWCNLNLPINFVYVLSHKLLLLQHNSTQVLMPNYARLGKSFVTVYVWLAVLTLVHGLNSSKCRLLWMNKAEYWPRPAHLSRCWG